MCYIHYTRFRVKDNINHLFIHLNLSIALALGLVVFLAGIENATKYRVSTYTDKFVWLFIIMHCKFREVLCVYKY